MKPYFAVEMDPAIAQASSAVLELGCGHGHFLVSQVIAEPSKTYIGVDCQEKRIGRARRKVELAGLRGIYFVHADVFDFLEQAPELLRWESIFLLFSDPWPKVKHHKHRLMQPRLLDLLSKNGMPGAKLYFRTDHAPYFEAAQKMIMDRSDWMVDYEALWPKGSQTIFEKYANGYQSIILTKI
jgi:tRNA (guanine-N7-)-methyltransferase